MVIFPFGFYILDGKTPVYVGNDLEAQKTVSAWKDANPGQVLLSVDQIGASQILTTFQGWDYGTSYRNMDQAPLLFATVISRAQQAGHERRYSVYDDALAGHAMLFKSVLAGRAY
jgi:hypothetical protein